MLNYVPKTLNNASETLNAAPKTLNAASETLNTASKTLNAASKMINFRYKNDRIEKKNTKFAHHEPISSFFDKPDLKKVYCKILSMFADSYNCESAFSNLAFILNKYRISLTQQHLKYALKISATNFNLNYEKLLKNCQKSH